MFKNYLKIALRNIKRNKGHSFINITGLAIGMACFILMLLLALDELSFNGFHKNVHRIYRVIIEDVDKSDLPIAVTQAPLAAALKKDFPAIIEGACFNYAGGGLVKYRDIGVVKDFHFNDLRNKINPLVIKLAPRDTEYMVIRVHPDSIPGTLAVLETRWKSFSPEYPFKFFFLEDRLDLLYMPEKLMGKLISVFTVLAILISCMGLFGLASFMTQQRTNEIGIRKAFGASVSGIVQLLSKEFLKWIAAANIIAWPIAFLLMSHFLRIYAYRTSIGVWPFLLAGVLALLIAVLSVGSQSIKTAKTNPVEALRYE